MSRAPNVALSAALQSHDQGEQLAALRSLKNDIVGHVQKKEKWIEAGILEPVVKILNTSRSATSHRRSSSTNTQLYSDALSPEEAVRSQALQVLASFANGTCTLYPKTNLPNVLTSCSVGGFAFLNPLHAAGALSSILSNISPHENPPQVVVSALRAALKVAESTPLALNTCDTELANLADVAFVPPLLDAFRDILGTPVKDHFVQTQRNLVAKLVSLLCREERHQISLADSGILDALATNLASVIVARGFAIPGAEQAAQNDGVPDLFPAPAAPGTDVTAIFEALSAIIGDSRWRASALIYSPAILTVFPNSGAPRRSKAIKSCAHALEVAGLSSILPKDLGLMDCFLPMVPEVQARGASAVNPFPPLGSSPMREAPSMSWNITPFNWDAAQTDFGTAPEGEVEDNESPLIPWLIQATRSSDGMERVMVASVVTSLFKAGLANKSREAYMGRLIVSILLQGLEDVNALSNNGEAAFTDTETAINRLIVERSLAVVSKLVVDSDFLQKCASDCSAVKIISKSLKGAYEPILSKPTRPWSSTPPHEKNGQREIGIPTSRLGPRGQVPLLAHHIRVREAALKAIAALAGKDEYGKAFVEQDLVPFIVESLSASPSKPTRDGPKSPKIKLGRDDGAEFDTAYGANPVSVIIAACHALRTLARSVSILRTTLQDCGVVSPAFRLLRHADIEVQIAASGLMCNLVTNVSPMRDVSTTF